MRKIEIKRSERKRLLLKALTGRSEVYKHIGAYESSMHDIDKAIENSTDKIQRFFLKLEIASILANSKNNYEEAVKIVNFVQSDNEAREHVEVYARSLEIMASILEGMGELEDSKKYYEKIISVTKKQRDRLKLASIYNQLGLVYESMGNYKKSISYFKKAHYVYLQKSDKLGMAIALANTGIVYWDMGRVDKALSLFKQYLAVSEQIGYKSGMSVAYGNIAMVLEDGGDLKAALAYYRKSLKVAREIGEKREISIVLENIGSLYSSIGSLNKAMHFFKKSFDIATELKDKIGICSLYQEMGNVYQAKGAFKKALVFYEKSLKLAYLTGSKLVMADAHYCMARILIQLSDYAEVDRHINKAMHIYKKIQSLIGMSWCYAVKSEYAIMKKEWEKAALYAQKAISIAEDTTSDKNKIYPLRLLGKALLFHNFYKSNKLQEFFTHFKNSIALARKLNLRVELALSLYETGMAYKFIGESVKSEMYLKEANTLYSKMNLGGYVRHLQAYWVKMADFYNPPQSK